MKRKGDKLYVKRKGYNGSFDSWTDKKDPVHMSECFPEAKSSTKYVKIEWDSYNYATKADLKNATGVDTSNFAKKTDLAI